MLPKQSNIAPLIECSDPNAVRLRSGFLEVYEIKRTAWSGWIAAYLADRSLHCPSWNGLQTGAGCTEHSNAPLGERILARYGQPYCMKVDFVRFLLRESVRRPNYLQTHRQNGSNL